MGSAASNVQRSTEPVAIAGLVSSILFWPAGLALNPIALSKVRSNGKEGGSLAIAGLCISIAGLLVTTALIVVTFLLAGPITDRALSAVVGTPVAIGRDITVTTSGLSCTIAEESHVECEVEAIIVNDSAEPITVGPDMVMKAVDVNGRSVTTVEMQPVTVQPGETREVVLAISARDDKPWFLPSTNYIGI